VPALAQGTGPGTTSFAFNIGWTMPQGDFSNVAESGYSGSIDFTYNLSKNLAFRTEFGRASNNIDSSKIVNASNFTATFYNYNLTENVIYTFNPDGQTNFYVIAGLGGAKATAEIGAFTYQGGVWYPWGGYYPVTTYTEAASQSTTRITYNAGIGVQFKISPSFIMSLESRYTVIATQQNIEYVPIAIGFRFM
jgi:opacity protein-like surface antigen